MARTLPAPTEATPRPGPRRPADGLVEAGFLVGTVLTTLAGATFVLQLWRATWRVPFFYAFDSIFDGMLIKGVLDHGWYQRNPQLGAPFGLRFEDFPLGGDNLQFLMIKALGVFSDDWAFVFNLYFLLSFALISAATYVVVRQLGVSRGPALVVGTLFSFLPYHFGVAELLQATYYAVPLGAFLVLDALGWDVWGPPFLGRATPDRPAHARLRWVVRGVLALIIASSGSYVTLFTVILVGVAGALRLLNQRDARALLRSGVVMGLLVAVLAVNSLPTLLYRRANGTNTQVAVRAPGESDTFALHIVDLFLPVLNHRVPPLAGVKDELNRWWPTSPIFPAPHVPLGLAGAVGLALSIAAALGAALRHDRGRETGSAGMLLARLGALNLLAILFGAATGFSALLALAGLTQIRVWSRISIFIGFFSLVAVALAAQLVAGRAGRRATAGAGARRLAGAGVVLAAVVLGLLDQTQPGMTPAYASTRSAFAGDRAFVAEIERRLPSQGMVFQLPLASFPERPPILAMSDYQLLRGYLHSTDTRWSYPAMRGRPTDWARSMGGRSVDSMLGDITAAGFRALYVDRAGFVDRAAGLEREVTRLAGPPVASDDGTRLFWDLQALADRQLTRLGADGMRAKGNLVSRPVVPAWKEGFLPPVVDPVYAGFGDSLYSPEVPGQPAATIRWGVSPATLELTNPLPDPRPVAVHFRAGTAGTTSGTLVVSAPGTADLHVAVGPEPRPVEVRLLLPPGATSVSMTSALPATISRSGVNAVFQIQNVTIIDIDDRRPPAG
jgi:phosphoglycerol transferase